jgi:hypothetical protein
VTWPTSNHAQNHWRLALTSKQQPSIRAAGTCTAVNSNRKHKTKSMHRRGDREVVAPMQPQSRRFQ